MGPSDSYELNSTFRVPSCTICSICSRRIFLACFCIVQFFLQFSKWINTDVQIGELRSKELGVVRTLLVASLLPTFLGAWPRPPSRPGVAREAAPAHLPPGQAAPRAVRQRGARGAAAGGSS